MSVLSRASRVFLGCISGAALWLKALSVPAAALITGVNLVNPLNASIADQNALIAQLKAADVKVVRVFLKPEDADIDFAKRLNAQGIRMELDLPLRYPPNGPTRANNPKFSGIWGGPLLSSADPELSKTYYQSMLDKLEGNGIALAGLELSNEINTAGYNRDIPLPGAGRNFSLADLQHDPEGQQIAKSFLQYLKVLAVLKDVRDHSKLNRQTPLISVGLADLGIPEGPHPNTQADSVSINATLGFLRANGLDNLVDGYGIHTYPWGNVSPSDRMKHFEKDVITLCHPAASGKGKPCWMTEWGLPNNRSCPLDDTNRTNVATSVMNDFRSLAKQGRLAAALYFFWQDPSSKTVDQYTIFRCGSLTPTGKAALTP